MKLIDARFLSSLAAIGISLSLLPVERRALASSPDDKGKPAGLQIRVHFDPAMSKIAARRPGPGHALEGPRGRAPVPDQRQPEDPADLRHRRRGLKPGEDAVIGTSAPWATRSASLADVPAGKYRVQALLHRYETFHRADGHTVKLPMDRGEGQQWNKAPGNFYSTPREVEIDPGKQAPLAITLDQVIPPIPPPATTKYIKHETIQSERLTKFWGRPMHLGAHVLLPEGFDSHPDAHYPLVIFHGHFPQTFSGFREEPPDPEPQAGVQRAVPPARLQSRAAGVRLTSSTRSGSARTIPGW